MESSRGIDGRSLEGLGNGLDKHSLFSIYMAMYSRGKNTRHFFKIPPFVLPIIAVCRGKGRSPIFFLGKNTRPLRSYSKSFGTLGQLLKKYPPLSSQKSHSAGGSRILIYFLLAHARRREEKNMAQLQGLARPLLRPKSKGNKRKIR